jgi:hypothetical protein
MDKVKDQLEKLIEVETATFCEGCELYFELSEKNNKQVA